MNMNLPIANNDAGSWLNLKSRVEKGRDVSRPQKDQWRYVPNLDIPRDDSETDFLHECMRHREPVDRLLEHWIRTGEFHEQHPQLRYFFCVRFDVAHEMLTYMTYIKNKQWTTIFPFPPKTEDEVLTLLLTEWWLGMGQLRFFDRLHDSKMMPE